MARLKLLDSISELKVKGDPFPLRTVITERVKRLPRSPRKTIDEQVSDAVRQIEIEEGAELSTMLPYEDLLSIREEIIPEALGVVTISSGKKIIPPKSTPAGTMDEFEAQFSEFFGTPKKASGGVVSLYNRPRYGLGGALWEGLTDNKIANLAK